MRALHALPHVTAGRVRSCSGREWCTWSMRYTCLAFAFIAVKRLTFRQGGHVWVGGECVQVVTGHVCFPP